MAEPLGPKTVHGYLNRENDAEAIKLRQESEPVDPRL